MEGWVTGCNHFGGHRQRNQGGTCLHKILIIGTIRHKHFYTKCMPAEGRHMPGFLKLLLSVKSVCVHVCLCVCVSAPEAINNYSHEMNL